jgi:GLPGLI family protein
MKNLFLFSVLSIFALTTVAQKNSKSDASFEGTITYNVVPDGEIDANVKAQLPTEVIMSFKGPKSSMVQKTSMGNITVIGNSETKEQTVLFDMMGQKMAIKSTKEETEKAISEYPEAKVNVTTETKKIAGYNCKKVEVTTNDKVTNIYVTDDIKVANVNWQSPYKNVTGIMLEYSQKTGQEQEISLTFTAKEVKKGKVKDDVFAIPSDYKEMTMAEFKKMMGGGEE